MGKFIEYWLIVDIDDFCDDFKNSIWVIACKPSQTYAMTYIKGCRANFLQVTVATEHPANYDSLTRFIQAINKALLARNSNEAKENQVPLIEEATFSMVTLRASPVRVNMKGRTGGRIGRVLAGGNESQF